MKTLTVLSAALLLSVGLLARAEAAGKPGGLIWAGCEAYKVLVAAEEIPNEGPMDNLYQGSFQDGAGAISDSAPGYGDYNGGRWSVYVLKDGVDGSKYGNACSVDDLDLNDFEKADVYLVCPLVPDRGHR